MPAEGDRELGRFVEIISTAVPENPISLDEIRWSDRQYPGGRRFLGLLGGEPVGAAGIGRAWSQPPEFDGLWANIGVLAPARRQGVGEALYRAISNHARSVGKAMLIGRTSEVHPDGQAFLEHRGFTERDRMKVVRLDLAGLDPPAIAPPAGITVTSLAVSPQVAEGVYEVACEAIPDIPGDGPSVPATFAEFRVRDVDRPAIPPGGFVVGLDDATGRVVGYASLVMVPGSTSVAWHYMTGVAREARGRGIATALKRATIEWAVRAGLEALEGANDVDNAPMRAVNRRLGYQPQPDEVFYRGPLAPEAPIAERSQPLPRA